MSNTVYLQGIGDTPAKMVSELSEGDVFVKNYGYKYKVLECSSLSSNTYELTFESLNSSDPGCRYTKHVRGSSLVGVEEDLRLLQQLHKAQKRATEKKRKEDEEKEKKRKVNQEVSANKQVSGEFASSASEDSTASKILTFMTERKLTKKEIKDRDEIADRLPSSEFKKRYSNPNPPARNWKDVMYAAATNIVKGRNRKESVELDETRDRAELIDLMNKTGARVASDTKTDRGRVTPKTNQALRIKMKARKRLGLPVESVELDELKTPTYKSYKRKAEKQETDLLKKGYFDLSPEERTKADKRREGANKANELILRRREGEHRDPPRPGREVKEAIADGKPKSKAVRRMDVATSSLDRMFRNKKLNPPGSARAKQRVNSAAFSIKMGRNPEEMKQSPYHTTQDVRSAQQFLKKVKEDINPKLKSFDLSGTGVDTPSINNKVYGTEGIKRGDGRTSTTGKDKKTGYEDPLKGYPYNK